jgi:hypothetical protein
MPNLGEIATILGHGFLGAAGPSGRAASASILNKRSSLLDAERQRAAEEQAKQEELALEKTKYIYGKTQEFRNSDGYDAAPEAQRKAADDVVVELGTKLGIDPNVSIGRILDKEGDGGFTLGQGQTRFNAQGQTIATVAPKPPSQADRANPILTFHNPETSEWVSARRDSQKADNLISEGWIETDFKSETGDIGQGAKDKRLTKFADLRENQAFLEKRIDRAIELAQKPGAMRGTLGVLANVAESVADQASQVFGKPVISGSKVDESYISENISATTRAALINGKLDANLVTIAFMLAQVNNPDGKISDQDVREANRMISGDQGSIPVMVGALQEVKRIGADRLSAQREVLIQDGLISGQSTSDIPTYIRKDGKWVKQ